MNTNLTLLQQVSNTATALVHQVQAWPAALLLAVCLVVLTAVLKIFGLPRRWSVVVVLVAGAGMAMLLGDVSKVPATQSHPRIILAMWGFLVASIALGAFKLLVKRFERYLPVLSRRNPLDDDDDTQITAKPKDENQEKKP